MCGKTMLPGIKQFIQSMESELQNSREHSWIEQLQREYDSICYLFNQKLRRPIIGLSDNDATLGTWDPVSRELRISKKLIASETWATVLGVLKHEMAHQLSFDVIGGKRDHDESFREACRRLGLNAPFNKSVLDLASIKRLDKESPKSENEMIARKVEKLLSLAMSQNENEAYAAMEKAQKLMREYNLSLDAERSEKNFVTGTIHTKKKRIDRHQAMVCSILNEHYFVRVIFSTEFDPRSLENYKTIEILGEKSNVAVAEYVHDYLMRTIDHLWQDYQRSHATTHVLKSSYQVGLLTGFRRKLERSNGKESTSSAVSEKHSTSLIRAEKELDLYVKSVYPKLSSHTTGRGRLDSSAYQHGCSDGEKIVVHRGVGASEKNSQRLIGPPSRGRGQSPNG